jgi:FAD/FMN-containing dehydrogenase
MAATLPGFDTAQQLAFALRRDLDGEVRFDPGSRHLYATDASNYRHVPTGVVLPRHVDDVAATLARCREAGVPVVTRGAGTSLAGQAAGAGVCWTARATSTDPRGGPGAATARVEPGVVLDRPPGRRVAGTG